MNRKILLGFAVMVLAALSLGQVSTSVPEAKTFAQLTINGAAVTGWVSSSSYGGLDLSADTFEAFGFTWEGSVDPASGARSYAPIRFKKRVDQASPAFVQAMVQGESVAGSFLFFDQSDLSPDPVHNYRITISGGRVTKVRNLLEGGKAPIEEVQLTFTSIVFEELVHSTLFVDSL